MQGLCAGFRQRQHGDAFFEQLHGLLRRAAPANGSRGHFALVHETGFLGKAIAHVLAVAHEFAGSL